MYSKIIRSDDENALEKLTQKAQGLKKMQEEMKQANQHFRQFGTMQGYGRLTDEEAARVDESIYNSDYGDKQPYAAYQLSNNRQNLRAIEKRIKGLEREESAAGEERKYDTSKYGFEVVENHEDKRLQLFFDGKPTETIRTALKGRGFKWSPSNGCWQRLLNDNARYALNAFIQKQEQHRSNAMEM